MTALCPGGGTSSANVGASAVTLLASGTIAVVLDKYGAGWLKWAIPLLALPELTLNTFCASDPPAIPTFTAAESKALIDVQLGADFSSALSKFGDLVQHLAWYELCHCNAGTATALPAAPAPPSGTPVYTPPAPTVSSACRMLGPFPHTVTTGQSFNRSGPALNDLPASYVRVTTTTVEITSPGPDITFAHQFQQPNGTNTVVHSYVQSAGTTVTQIYAVPNDAITTQLQTRITAGAGAGSTSEQTVWEVWCGGQFPGSSQQACCPPDVATQASLDLILKMVTLIQRQSVPFAYVASTAHAALTGAGSFAIQGLLGIKADVTTLPATLGVSGTSPAEHFDLGFITFGTADGYPQSIRLEHQGQLMLPARCSVFTTLAYDLHPGVVVTLTELLREP